MNGMNAMSTSKTMSNTATARLLLAGLLLGSVAMLGACSPTETRTTTTEQTTSHQVVPMAPASSSVTTTKTQVYTP
jgi:ABC-type uncharacterized transport system auxiliary subunit